jgi:hypothetical protein
MGISRLAIICAGLLAVGVSVQNATGAPPTIQPEQAATDWSLNSGVGPSHLIDIYEIFSQK